MRGLQLHLMRISPPLPEALLAASGVAALRSPWRHGPHRY